MKKKILVDILLFVFIILEFSRPYMPTYLHELFGIILLFLLIVHLIFNRNYLKNIFKGKWNLTRIIMLVVNLSFFITFALALLFGILSSVDILKFLNIHNIKLVEYHKTFAFISLIFMGLHIGINISGINDKLNKIIKNKIIIYLLQIVLIIYGIYSCDKLDIIKHITGSYGFSMIDGNIIIDLLRYSGIVIMISIVSSYVFKFVKQKNMKKIN